ncbi:MAG: SRPBCC domain-containing protein [Gammaproteobacteria bacterium]|nr:SRPBCC domain-containing protein [Gammaproteobacteria bacterium]
MNSFSIHKTRHINASPEAVFDVLTSSEHIVRYFPLKQVTSSWHEGGEILLDGEVDGRAFRDHGVIEILSRPAQFKYRYWSDNHGTEQLPENCLVIDYRLAPEQHGTKLTLEQSNIKSGEQAQRMESMWPHLLDSLAAYVENKHSRKDAQ